MEYSVRRTSRFQKQYGVMSKRGFDMLLLDDVIRLLATGQVLPQKNRDHTLSGNYAGHRECHIAPDWLLIYRVDSKMLILELMQTGTHSDLF